MTNRHNVTTSEDYGLVGESWDILPEREGVGTLLNLLVGKDDEWMSQGWCHNQNMLQAWDIGPDAWMEPMPDTGTFDPRARELCEVCPVRERCHQWALDNDERWGLWGGRGPSARRDIWMQGGHSCPHGHEYTPENTYTNPRTGKYRCRKCEAIRLKDRRNQRKAALRDAS